MIDQKAPLAEPDCESPGSELQPSELIPDADAAASKSGDDSKPEAEVDEAKNSEICPWEDE